MSFNRREDAEGNFINQAYTREENRMSAGRIVHPEKQRPREGKIFAGRIIHPEKQRITKDWDRSYHFGSEV